MTRRALAVSFLGLALSGGCPALAPPIEPREAEGESDGAALSAPPTLNLGNACVGGSCRPPVEAELLVTNTGDASSGPLSLSIEPAGAFSVASSTCAAPLAAGSSCAVHIRFEPFDFGASNSATLSIEASPGGAVLVQLSGTAVACDDILVIQPPRGDFPDTAVGAVSPPVRFSVTNVGALAYQSLTTTLSGAAATDFQLGADGCAGATLEPGRSCTFEVAFAPGNAGARAATVVVTSPSLCANTATAALMGIGT